MAAASESLSTSAMASRTRRCALLGHPRLVPSRARARGTSAAADGANSVTDAGRHDDAGASGRRAAGVGGGISGAGDGERARDGEDVEQLASVKRLMRRRLAQDLGPSPSF